jgi:hypothetical protein
MRWFTDAAHAGEDGEWDEAVDGYAAHLAAITPLLPTPLAALASDPRFDLHDGRFHEVVLDHEAQEITLAIDCGDIQVGYRRLTLRFERASVVPDNLLLLAEAVGAEFRPNHWHNHKSVTEIRFTEVDVVPGDKYILRMRLWPFHEFGIEFGAVSITELALEARSPRRAGRFFTRG